jgi:NADPH-dependent ferric siderophore reductase
MTVLSDTVTAWRFFEVRVAAVRRLSPTYVRLTFTGADLDDFADNGWDQRFKLVLPAPAGGYEDLPTGPDWHTGWRQLPDERRPPIRTYTVRAVRPERCEVDVDMVLHGDSGPASRFAGSARVGDPALLLGPNTRYDGAHGGLEFRPPPGHTGPTLLAADETAVPAVLAILERLPADAFGEAVLEVPDAADIADVAAPVGVRLTWLVRQPAGSGLDEAVRNACDRIGVRGASGDQEPVDNPSGDDLLWEVPETATSGFYAWLAGESSIVTGLRRHLVRERGVDKRQVAFMAYWKSGRVGG